MMDMKENVDIVYGLESPLAWGTEGRPARRVQREWVKAIGRILKEKEGGKIVSQGEDAIEVWDIRIMNRCEGWVVEPWHCGIGSLVDDDDVSPALVWPAIQILTKLRCHSPGRMELLESRVDGRATVP